jgi:hypothetical protein
VLRVLFKWRPSTRRRRHSFAAMQTLENAMTTLTFDYRDSYKPIHHDATIYSAIAEAWQVTPNAWNGQAFDVQPITVQDSDTTTFEPDITHAHLENWLQPVSAADVIRHSPAPGYFDLWITSLGSFPFMRVPAEVPTPPNWTDIVKPYYAMNASPTYDQDVATWVDDIIFTWKAQLEQLSTNPVSEVSLGDSGTNRIFATISADTAIPPREFMNFDHYANVVYGSKFNDIIDGGNIRDELFGEQGNDVLTAGTGPANLDGGPGNDRLIAGAGGDNVMTGGSGRDRFVFLSASDSPPGPLHDVIMDFHHTQHDKISLGFATGFAFIDHQTFARGHVHHLHAPGLVRIAHGNIVEASLNGDNLTPVFELKVHGSALQHSDLIL